MKKAVFISSPQMNDDYYKLVSNDTGKIIDGKMIFELSADEYTIK